MPYKRRKPVSEKSMLKTRYEGHHTICQVLRDIYLLTNNEEIKLKCRLGMAMAKSMQDKLKEYKNLQGEIVVVTKQNKDEIDIHPYNQYFVDYYVERGCSITICKRCGMLLYIKWPLGKSFDGPSISSGMYCQHRN